MSIARASRTLALLSLAAVSAVLASCGGSTSLPGAPSGTQALGRPMLQAHRQSGGSVPAAIEWLMTDGTVLVQDGNNANAWYSYAPDSSGSYSDGTWTQVASMPSGYAPSAGASQVLADGRFLFSGGEYNSNQFDLTNLGAIYDPVKNTWTALGHPSGWGWIGDSPSTMLPNNLFLIGDKLHKWDATYDPKTAKWAHVGDAGKADFNAEEGWTLLADGTVLTVDVKNDPDSEIYNPSTGQWKTAGKTPVILASHWNTSGCLPYGTKKKDCYYPPGEIGPAILRPDGSVFATGSGDEVSGAGTGHTAIYYSTGSKAGTWKKGPDFPNNDNAGDSFGLLEPSGNVMVFGDDGGVSNLTEKRSRHSAALRPVRRSFCRRGKSGSSARQCRFTHRRASRKRVGRPRSRVMRSRWLPERRTKSRARSSTACRRQWLLAMKIKRRRTTRSCASPMLRAATSSMPARMMTVRWVLPPERSSFGRTSTFPPVSAAVRAHWWSSLTASPQRVWT